METTHNCATNTMLGGLADYHRKRMSDVGDMPVVDSLPPEYDFFNEEDEDVPDVPPVARRLSVNPGVLNEALDVHHVQPKQLTTDLPVHQVTPPATIAVIHTSDFPVPPNRIASARVRPPTAATISQRRRSTIHVAPVKKRPTLLQCCFHCLIAIIIGLLLVLLGVILEGKVFHIFQGCAWSVNGLQSSGTSSTSGSSQPQNQRVNPSPYCPFGSAMLSEATGNQSTHSKALQITEGDELSCRNECQSIPSCVRAVFAAAEGNQCYLELTDSIDATGAYVTCTKSHNQLRNCPSNLPCKAWVKMCQCGQAPANFDYATVKNLLNDVASAIQCSHTATDGEDYLDDACSSNYSNGNSTIA